MSTSVNAQSTDAVSEVTTASVGFGISVPTVQSFLSRSQAQSTLFAAAVGRQEQLSVAGLAATVRGVAQILKPRRPLAPVMQAAAPPAPKPKPKPKPKLDPNDFNTVEQRMAEELAKSEAQLRGENPPAGDEDDGAADA